MKVIDITNQAAGGGTASVPQIGPILEATNEIDFSLANNFTITATMANMTAINLVAGQSGVILIEQATNIVGWSLEFMFIDAPPELYDYEIFAYFVIDSSTVFMGRVQ